MSSLNTDVVVIGAGPAGYVCAIRLAQLGKKVVVVEREYMGGVCLNVGCIPSKALIYTSSIFEKIKHSEGLGIRIKGEVEIDFPQVMKWKEGVVGKLTGGVAGLLKANGCEVISGSAAFTGLNSLEVKKNSGETVSLRFENAVIATGSRAAQIPGFEVDQKTVWDSTGALSQEAQPKELLCLGGGYIGLELGTFYAKIGTKVTVVEASPNLLGMVDPALTQVVEKKLKALGVEVLKGTRAYGKGKKGKGFAVELEGADGKRTVREFEKVLVTVGRVPNSEGLGLDRIGLVTDSKGFIEVDDQRRTRIPTIFAIGDVAGQPLLAHKGSKEGVIAAEVIAGLNVAYDSVSIPAVVFTDPEVATVGLSEAEAKAKGIDVMVGQFPFVANGRALSVGEPDGFVKMVGDKKTGRLLGVHIVGAEASNLIAEAALALEMGALVEDLALTVHAHPTLPETLMEAAEATLGHAIHIFQRKPKSAAAARTPEAHA